MARRKYSLKEIRYILWEYYRWLILVVGLLIIFLITFFGIQLTKKTDAFNAFVVNGYLYNEENDFVDQFAESAQIDTDKYQISIECLQIGESYDEASLVATQTIAAFTASQRLDLAVMDIQSYAAYAQEGLFADLRNVLSADQLDTLTGYFYYIEASHPQSPQQAGNTIISKDPSVFSSPIPIGIDITSFERFTDVYFYPENNCCLGIVASSTRKDNSAKFIDFIITE